MNINFIGFTLDVIGKILLGATVLFAHERIMREHRIDKKVIIEMKREQILGFLGIALIIIGYLMQMPYKI